MKKIRNTLIVVFAAFALAAFALSGCTPSDLKDGYIMEGVSVAGVEIGGMTKEDALSAVRLATADIYASEPMVIQLLDETITLSPELTGIALDPEAAVETAYAIGRDISNAEYEALKIQAMTTGIQADISGCFTVSKDSLRTILTKLCEEYTDSVLTHGSYEIIGEIPDLAAEELPEELQTLVITTGTPQFHLDINTLCDQVMSAYASCKFQVESLCQVTEPDPVDLDAVFEEIYSEPVEPVMDQETFEVSDHAYGYGFALDEAKALVSQAGYGETVEIPLVAVAPEQTKEALASLLFRDVLSKASSFNKSSISKS